MKYIACAGAPLTEMIVPRVTVWGAQHIHHFAQQPRIEILEQRHACQHAEGDDEIALVDRGHKTRRHDADGQGQDAEAHNHRAAGNHSSKKRDGDFVAITHRRQRRDRPPHRTWDGAEPGRWIAPSAACIAAAANIVAQARSRRVPNKARRSSTMTRPSVDNAGE